MRTLAATFVLVAIAVPIDAHHCATYSTSRPEIDAAGIYVENDLCQDCMFSVWVYQESNGIEGLQRGGEHPRGYSEYTDDTCHRMIEPDTLLL